MKKQIKKLRFSIPVFSMISFTPLIALAQNATNANGVLDNISNFLSALLPLLVSIGVIYFVWGVVQYVINDSDEAKKKGKDRIIYGIIGLAVILSIWGLVNILIATFGVGGGNVPNVSNLAPAVNTTNSGFGCQTPLPGTAKVQNLLGYVTCLINDSVIPFIFALAVVMFIWGAIKFFIIGAGEEKKRDQGKQFMIWGIVALAVMLSVWGLVGILRNTFGVDIGSGLPQVQP